MTQFTVIQPRCRPTNFATRQRLRRSGISRQSTRWMSAPDMGTALVYDPKRGRSAFTPPSWVGKTCDATKSSRPEKRGSRRPGSTSKTSCHGADSDGVLSVTQGDHGPVV
jgi:hypothetical protein